MLLAERISIRDLGTILEGIADGLSFTRNHAALSEHVRARLARQICAQHATPAGYLPLISLSPKWEQAFAESLTGQGDDRQLAMAPSRLTEFITLVRERFEEAARQGEAPVLVTSPAVRPFVALDRRALPLADQRAVAVGDSSAGAAQDAREYLSGGSRQQRRAVGRNKRSALRHPLGQGSQAALRRLATEMSSSTSGQ